MKKIGGWFRVLSIASLAVCVLALGPSAFAKGKGGEKGLPGGFEKGEKKGWGESKTPPGWSQGEKKGWGEKDMPPGLAEDE